MSKVKIGGSERPINEATESWINQQINSRKDDKQTVCVQVFLDEGGVDMVLSTPTCGGGGGGNRRPTTKEQEIFDLWNRRGLNQSNFTGGALVAFLKQLERLL